MTRPKYREAITRERNRDRRFRIPDCPLETEQLRELSPFRSAIRQQPETNCRGCGVLIEVGDTCFYPTNTLRSQVPGVAMELISEAVLCYCCGVSWETHEGRLAYADARALSPYANAHLDRLGDR